MGLAGRKGIMTTSIVSVPVDEVLRSLNDQLLQVHPELAGRRLIGEIALLAWRGLEKRYRHYAELSQQGTGFKEVGETADGLPQTILLPEGGYGFHVVGSTFLGTDLDFYRFNAEAARLMKLDLRSLPVWVLEQLRAALRD
jgi:hypothetical protein